MTTHKVEEIMQRIVGPYLARGEDKDVRLYVVDPHKLASVLVEMEERIAELERPVIVGTPLGETPDYKAGFLAALEEVRERANQHYGSRPEMFQNELLAVFGDLKKKYE